METLTHIPPRDATGIHQGPHYVTAKPQAVATVRGREQLRELGPVDNRGVYPLIRANVGDTTSLCRRYDELCRRYDESDGFFQQLRVVKREIRPLRQFHTLSQGLAGDAPVLVSGAILSMITEA
jgi:hypothetical protein